jgi:hypothetical protein
LQKRTLILFEEIIIWIFAVGMIGIFTALEWLRWSRTMPPHPFVATTIFLLLGIFVVAHIKRVKGKLRNYNLGLLGERYVAERLNELREDGYYIIHDIPCGRMNIDHVLVGPAGVFTIETKMARKDVDRLNEITHTEKGVMTNGKRGWGQKAVWEATKEAEYLQEILHTDGSEVPSIQPVVLYPGWFVKDDCSRKVWVLNDLYFLKKISSLSSVLSKENVQVLRRKIEAYAREKTEKLDYA